MQLLWWPPELQARGQVRKYYSNSSVYRRRNSILLEDVFLFAWVMIFVVPCSSKFASGHYSIGGDGDPGRLVVEHCKKHLRKIALLNPEGTVRKIYPQLLLFSSNFWKEIMYVQVWYLQYMRSENFLFGKKFWIIWDPDMQPCFCAYNTGYVLFKFCSSPFACV
jgi:hypothetical protein